MWGKCIGCLPNVFSQRPILIILTKKIGKKSSDHLTILFPDVGKYASNAYLMFFFEGPQNKLKKIQILHNGFFTQCGKKYNL